MGYALDWVSVQGLDKDDVLQRLGYADSGQSTDFLARVDFAWAATSKGRIVVVGGYDALRPERLAALSQGASLVAARVENHVGESHAWGYEDGRCVWSIAHSDQGHYDDEYGLTIDGDLPAAFGAIRERLLAEQRAAAEDDEEFEEDLFDLPAELVATLGGWAPEGEGEELAFFKAIWSRADAPASGGGLRKILQVFGLSR